MGIEGSIPGRILSITAKGTDEQTVDENLSNAPDGLTVDTEEGYIYFSQMGSVVVPDSVNGTIERARLDGTERTVLVREEMKTYTPKQLIRVDVDGEKKLYWGDREGMRVMRANTNGSNIETVVDTRRAGSGPPESKMVVGVAADTRHGWLYWTQKGDKHVSAGSIRRARLHAPLGVTADNRTDAQILLEGLPQPIDLHLVSSTQTLYWTERGVSGIPGSGNVKSLFVGAEPTVTAEPKYVAQGLGEAIGIAVDERNGRIFFDIVTGEVYSCGLDGSDLSVIKGGLEHTTGVYLV